MVPFTEVRKELRRWENPRFKLKHDYSRYLVDIQVEVGQVIVYSSLEFLCWGSYNWTYNLEVHGI